LKVSGKIAVDTNAVIAYREGIVAVCTLMEGADTIFLPVVVLGELLYGAVNSAQPQKNEQAVRLLTMDRHFDYVQGLQVINW